LLNLASDSEAKFIAKFRTRLLFGGSKIYRLSYSAKQRRDPNLDNLHPRFDRSAGSRLTAQGGSADFSS